MKEFIPAIMSVALSVLFFGLIFPLLIWGGGQLAFFEQANGSLIRDKEGKIIGSRLIGQKFSSAKYFQGRPSAAGTGYDPTSSGGTNLGPTSSKLINGIKDDPGTGDVDESYAGLKELAASYRKDNELPTAALIPSDAVTHSASGLDPEISIANAYIQAKRVAKARGMKLAAVEALIGKFRKGRFLGVFGEPRLNVLEINLELDAEKVSAINYVSPQ